MLQTTSPPPLDRAHLSSRAVPLLRPLLRAGHAFALPLLALTLTLVGSIAVAEASSGSRVPAVPEQVRADVYSHRMIMLKWAQPEGESDLFGYVVTVDGNPVGATRDTRFRVRLAQPTTSYRLGVRAATASRLSAEATVEATTLATPEQLRASAPEALRAKVMPDQQVELAWTAPDDTPRLRRYLVTVGGKPVARTRDTRFRLKRLLPGTDYDIGVLSDYGPRWPSPVPATVSVRTPDDSAGKPARPEPDTGAPDPYPDGATGADPASGLPTHAPDGTPYCD